MRRVMSASVAVVALGVLVAAQGFSTQRSDAGSSRSGGPRGCSVGTLRGAYGIEVQGTRPAASTGSTEWVIGVVLRVYDGAGQFTQVDNIKGSLTGIVPDRTGFGTYEVNEDCTAVAHFQPGPGISLEERMVIVAGGDEVVSIVSGPLKVMMSGRQTRVSGR
jgi:hypothetical protein